MRLLFPQSPLSSRQPDELVVEQFRAFRKAGHPVALFSFEKLQQMDFVISSPPGPSPVLYRGWMLKPAEYKLMHDTIGKSGGAMFTNTGQYLAAHHLPNWYPLIPEYTPETVVMAADKITPETIAQLGWSGFFIKDFVKSLKTSHGSVITDLSLLQVVMREMHHFRGEIEGGICLRRLEQFETDTETRYFVIRGVAYAHSAGVEIPKLVSEVAKRIPCPFFSIDIAKRTDGVWRVVELGDEQVTDLVNGWSADRFVEIWSRQRPSA
jgi:hypothetical protein